MLSVPVPTRPSGGSSLIGFEYSARKTSINDDTDDPEQTLS